MSLLIAKTTFDSQFAAHLKSFFSNDPTSQYFVNPLDSDGNLKDEEDLRAEGDIKINLFSTNIGNIIYNFIASAEVNPGIPVTTYEGVGSTTGPGTVS